MILSIFVTILNVKYIVIIILYYLSLASLKTDTDNYKINKRTYL